MFSSSSLFVLPSLLLLPLLMLLGYNEIRIKYYCSFVWVFAIYGDCYWFSCFLEERLLCPPNFLGGSWSEAWVRYRCHNVQCSQANPLHFIFCPHHGDRSNIPMEIVPIDPLFNPDYHFCGTPGHTGTFGSETRATSRCCPLAYSPPFTKEHSCSVFNGLWRCAHVA